MPFGFTAKNDYTFLCLDLLVFGVSFSFPSSLPGVLPLALFRVVLEECVVCSVGVVGELRVVAELAEDTDFRLDLPGIGSLKPARTYDYSRKYYG